MSAGSRNESTAISWLATPSDASPRSCTMGRAAAAGSAVTVTASEALGQRSSTASSQAPATAFACSI
eukprot:732886-Rhodomonas_salina.2